MFSSAVSVGTRLNAWKMKPMRSRRSCVSWRSFEPADVDVADRDRARRQRVEPGDACMSVDLPEPDGPMMAVKRPESNSTLMPSSARTSASPRP
jgi:hypothetical protein